jgi:hypothetical protein
MFLRKTTKIFGLIWSLRREFSDLDADHGPLTDSQVTTLGVLRKHAFPLSLAGKRIFNIR